MNEHKDTQEINRETFYANLLLKRRPEVADADNRFARLAAAFGAEAVVSVLDAVDDLSTPEPTALQAGLLALHAALVSEADRNLWVTIS